MIASHSPAAAFTGAKFIKMALGGPKSETPPRQAPGSIGYDAGTVPRRTGLPGLPVERLDDGHKRAERDDVVDALDEADMLLHAAGKSAAQ